MALDVKVGTFTSVAGPQTINVGFQPKVVIIFGEYRGASGRRSESIGACDGTNNSARGISTNDAAWGRVGRMTSDSCVLMEHQGTGIVLKAAITAFTTTGFTIDFTTHSQSETFTYLALGGTDISNVAVGSFVFPTGNTHTLNLGFQPDAMMLASLNTAALDIGYSKVRSSMGFFDGIAAHSIGQSERSDGTHDRGGWKTGVVSVLPGDATTGTTTSSVYELTAAFQPSGVDFTKTVGGTTQGAHFYVAIKGPQFKVGNQAFPAVTGAQSITGVGFQPAAILFQADGRDLTEGSYGRPDWGFLGASDVTTDSAVAIVNRPTSYSEDTRYSTTYSVLHEDYTSGTLSAADVTSFDADGYTLNWTVVASTQRMLGWLAVGPAAATGGGQTILLGQALENHSAFSLGRSKTKPIGQSIVNHQALAITKTKVKNIGQAIVAHSALALAIEKSVVLGQSVETHNALQISKLKNKIIGIAQTSHTALPIYVRKGNLIPLGLAVENHIALPLSRLKVKGLGLAISKDYALPLIFDTPQQTRGGFLAKQRFLKKLRERKKQEIPDYLQRILEPPEEEEEIDIDIVDETQTVLLGDIVEAAGIDIDKEEVSDKKEEQEQEVTEINIMKDIVSVLLTQKITINQLLKRIEKQEQLINQIITEQKLTEDDVVSLILTLKH